MFKAFYNWFICSARLMTMPVPNKLNLIACYAKIQIKNLIFQWMGTNATSETFLGFRFDFFNYSTFVYLFEEIFMQQNYYFQAKSHSPRVIDCGCNVGMAILYVKWLYPQAEICGFEPDARTFEVLQKNIQQNSLNNVRVHNMAIADHEGEMVFYTEVSRDGSPQMSLQSASGRHETQTVRCTSLKNYLTGPIDLLKMDIEGAEGVCIQDLDAKQGLPLIRQIIMECHHNIQERPLLSQILSTLERNNFKYQISSNQKAPVQTITPQDVMIYAHLS